MEVIKVADDKVSAYPEMLRILGSKSTIELLTCFKHRFGLDWRLPH